MNQWQAFIWLYLPSIFGVSLLLIRWLVPIRLPVDLSQESISQYHQQHSWRLRSLAILSFVLVIALTLLITWLLIQASWFRDSTMPPHLLVVGPTARWTFWLIPGLFLGMASAQLVGVAIAKLVIRDPTFLAAVMMQNSRSPVSLRATYWAMVAIVVAASIWIPLGMQWYTRFESDQMAMRTPISGGEKNQAYSAIKRAVVANEFVAPSGHVVQRASLIVFFADGSRWMIEDDQPEFSEVVRIIKDRINSKIERIQRREEV